MKKSGIIILFILSACGGSVSDEQRKQMREASELQTVQKVTDAEITEAAFAKGREVMSRLKDNDPDTEKLEREQKVNINWLVPGSTNGLAIEQQLIDAYLNSLIEGTSLQDNVQKIGTDSLLYTSPVMITRADSSVEIKGTWNIWMSKKQLILAMDKK